MAKTVEIMDRSLRVTIEQMDNGVSMLVRREVSPNHQGIIILKKVYLDFDSLVIDLRSHLEFRKDTPRA